MKLNLTKSGFLFLGISVSVMCFSEQREVLSPFESLYTIPALKVGNEGTIVERITSEDISVVQVVIPITYAPSACLSFEKNNTISFVELELPSTFNEEQRAYEVRSYFSRNKKASLASTLPLSFPDDCSKTKEVTVPVTLKLRMDNKINVLATTISIPMENEMSRFLVSVEMKTGKVKIQPFRKMEAEVALKNLASEI